jgi:drug/metabolite transporter (DMT)-like permease
VPRGGSREAQMGEASSPPADHLERGIVLIVLAFLCLALISAFAQAASDPSAGSISSGMIVFFQYAISLVVLFPWFLRNGVASLKTHRLGIQLVWSVFGLGSQFLLFVALTSTPLLDAVLLANTSPLFIPLVVWAWQKLRPSLWLAICLLLGFVGIVLILQPGGTGLTVGMPIAIAAGVCSAIGLTAAGMLQTTEPAARSLFWYFFLSPLIVLPFLPSQWTMPTPHGWMLLLGIGVCMAAAQVCTVLAYKQASPARLSPFNYSVVVFSALIGWLIFHQVPNAITWAGVVLVCVAGILSTQKHMVAGMHLMLHHTGAR